MQDGVCENFTASMLTPYLDAHGQAAAGAGASYFDPEELKAAVTAIDARGFQVHFHAIGDRAVRETLDAVEAARTANGPGRGRHHVSHLQVVHPDDLPRFRALSVIANCQPLWACYEPQMTELTLPFLGQERAGWQYPFGSLSRSGAQLCFGSDWPVSSANPLWEMHTAVNRTVAPGYPYAGPGRESLSCRPSGSTSRPRSPPSPSAPPTSTMPSSRPARSRSASRPISSCWTGTCSASPPTRSRSGRLTSRS